MRTPTVFNYLRYSSTNQTGGVSLEMQQGTCRQFIERTPEFKGTQVVEKADEAKTGTTFAGRRGFNAILTEAKPGDSLVIYKYDRLGRNLLESLQNLKRLEEELKVSVYSATEPNTPVVRNLMLTMAEEYSRQLGERCKKALDTVAERGFCANKAPYGYTITRPDGPKGRAKLEPVPEEAKFVRMAFEKRAEGYSYYSIAKILNDQGAMPRRSRYWSTTALKYMLANETYLGRSISGIRIYKKGYRGPGSGKKRPRSQWHIGENAHEALVTMEIWDTVRATDMKKDATPRSAVPATRHKYLWTGFLRCSECGGNLNRISTKNGIWYGCENGRRHGQGKPCNKRLLVREDKLTKAVMETFRKQLYTEVFVENVVRIVRTELKAATASTEEFLRPLRNTLTRTTREIDAAERRLVRIPEDSLPVFLEELNELKAHRDDLRKKIAEGEKMSGGVVDPDALEGRIRERLDTFWEVFASKQAGDARAELAKHIDHIVVSHDKTAELFPKQDGLLVGLLPKVLLAREVMDEKGGMPASEDQQSGLCGIPTGI